MKETISIQYNYIHVNSSWQWPSDISMYGAAWCFIRRRWTTMTWESPRPTSRFHRHVPQEIVMYSTAHRIWWLAIFSRKPVIQIKNKSGAMIHPIISNFRYTCMGVTVFWLVVTPCNNPSAHGCFNISRYHESLLVGCPLRNSIADFMDPPFPHQRFQPFQMLQQPSRRCNLVVRRRSSNAQH